jgi:ethanolamine permease
MASKGGIEGTLASVSVDSGNGQKAETEASRLVKIGPFSIWALGITIVIGGQMFSWNQMLVSGFGSTIISVIMVGTAYICLCLCNSEMTSALPFAGGAYGLARVTLGLQAGFLIGCCESMQYILYVAASFRFLAEVTASICNTSKFTVPIYSGVYYIIACTILIIGGNFFWQISTVFGMVSLLIIVMYCLGSLPFVDISRYAPDPGTTGIYSAEYNKQWFIGGMSSFMYTLPLASWFFIGVESLSLCGSVVREPKLSIPIGSLSCVSILFISSIFVVCVFIVATR